MCGHQHRRHSPNKPRAITQGNGWDSQFWYDAERSRWKQSSLGGFGNEVRYYVGGIYENVFTGGLIEHHHFIQVAGRTVALVERVSGNEETRWLHHDHLGSLEVMTDSNGAPVGEPQSYDAWGKRRDPLTWVTPRTGLSIADGFYTPGTVHAPRLPRG